MTFESYLLNLLESLIWPLIFWGILAFSMHKDRSRYRNCFLLMLAGWSSLSVISALAGPYQGKASLMIIVLILLTILLVPAMLIANGVIMLRKEGHSLGNLLSLILGLVVGFGELSLFFVIAVPTMNFFQNDSLDVIYELLWGQLPWLLILIALSVIYLSMSFVSFMFYTLFLEIVPRKRDFDYIIIHGSGLLRGNQISKLLADRMDKAIEVYHKDPTPPVLVPSGGQGTDETVSEADAMAEYLREKGIPEEHILIENQSMTTFENLRNSKKLIEERSGEHYTALVTSNYHVYRALRYCRKIGLKCTGIGAHVAAYYWPSALIREYAAIHREKKHLLTFLLGWTVLILIPMLIVMAIG